MTKQPTTSLSKKLKGILLSYEEPLFSWYTEQHGYSKYCKDHKKKVKEFQTEVLDQLLDLFSSEAELGKQEVLLRIKKQLESHLAYERGTLNYAREDKNKYIWGIEKIKAVRNFILDLLDELSLSPQKNKEGK